MRTPSGKLSLAKLLYLNAVSTGVHRHQSLFALLLEVEDQLRKGVRGNAAPPGKHKIPVVQDFNQSLRRSLPRYIE
jgi:hypothetical protein